jgi:hypothetical protein
MLQSCAATERSKMYPVEDDISLDRTRPTEGSENAPSARHSGHDEKSRNRRPPIKPQQQHLSWNPHPVPFLSAKPHACHLSPAQRRPSSPLRLALAIWGPAPRFILHSSHHLTPLLPPALLPLARTPGRARFTPCPSPRFISPQHLASPIPRSGVR